MQHAFLALLCALALIGLAACGGQSADSTTGATSTPPAKDTAAKPADGPPEECPTVETTWRGDGNVIEFTAWQMGCSGCESTITKRLTAIDGVTAVTADHTTATIKVELDDAAKRDAVIEAITPALEKPESGRAFEIVKPKQ